MKLLVQMWDRVWFKKDDGLQIEIIRFLVGCIVFINYAGLTPYLNELYSASGWVNESAIAYQIETPWIFSVFFWLRESWQIYTFHVVFLLCCFCFTIGYRTSWVKWLVLIGHISYLHRDPAITYGFDNVTASILLILCLAPVGKSFSFDAARHKYRKKLKDLNAPLAYTISPFNFACVRLIQLQMAVLYFFSAVEKLRGETWWSGDALWIALNNFEFTNIPIGWLADHYWLGNLLTYSTLMIEMGYTFLIWGRASRPYFLVAALCLHLGIAVLMGLYLFASVMAVGHLAFLRTEWISRCLTYWKQRFQPMTFYYDGDCGFCHRSMAWLLTFDAMNQVKVVDMQKETLASISKEEHDQALYLDTGNGKVLAGFYAYRYAVNRIPGLFWLMPFFNIPFLSRWVGVKVYRYVADHRYQLSKLFFTAGKQH